MDNEIGEILKILIENRNEKFSIRKISLLRRINYKSAYQAVMKLEKKGVIALEKLGNTTNCIFNNRFNPLVFNVEYERRENLLKNKNLKILYSTLKEIKQPFIALLFGSYVKKKQAKNSDIDLLAIIEDKKQIEEEISLMPLNIHLTSVNYKEFLEMAKSKEFSVVSEALKNNIILIGIEEYYRILENVV